MPPRLLEGEVIDPKDEEIARLKLEIRRLQRVAADAETEAGRAREDADRAMANLRSVLEPLYRGLRMVFGEFDAAGVTGEPVRSGPASGPMVDDRLKTVWEAWKSRLPPACGKVIDALMIHGDLNREQLKVAARIGTSTVDASIGKLNKNGLLEKNGGRYSLKKL